MKILITGGAGFVGSSLALFLKENYPAYDIICFDNLKRRGSELNIRRLQEKEIRFLHGDIRNAEDFSELPPVDCVLECSAEPSVLAGIHTGNDYLVHTNLNGTIHCLNFARQHGASLIFLSTSRIYPINQLEKIKLTENENRFLIDASQSLPGITTDGISEHFPLDGNRSLYGASKLAAELFITEYNHAYNLKTVINRCGVISGPWQMGKIDQGVIVLWMARHFWKQPLSYIGFGGLGKQVRDILHVKDLYRLIDYQIHHMQQVNGQVFNVGGGKEISVSLKELTHLCQSITGNKIQLSSVAENREADIKIYVTDNTKVKSWTGWAPQKSATDILTDIYEWIQDNRNQLETILK